MRRIVLLWLLLTPVWIAFSFYASASNIAFVPPALVVAAVVLHWVHKQFVLLIAGEAEPHASAHPRPSWSFPPVPARSLVHPALIAVGVGACVGAAATPFLLNRALHDSAVLTKRTAAQPNSTVSVPTKPVKSQSLSAEPKPAQTEAVQPQPLSAEPKTVQTEAAQPQPSSAQPKIVQTEAVQPASAQQNIQDNAGASSANPDAKRAEAPAAGQNVVNQAHCNVSLCESQYQSFRASDCTYQPFSGPRQYCAR